MSPKKYPKKSDIESDGIYRLPRSHDQRPPTAEPWNVPRENAASNMESGPLKELRRQLESLSTLGSSDCLGELGSNAAAAAAAAVEAALESGNISRDKSTRVERLLQERQRSMQRIKSSTVITPATEEDDDTCPSKNKVATIHVRSSV